MVVGVVNALSEADSQRTTEPVSPVKLIVVVFVDVLTVTLAFPEPSVNVPPELSAFTVTVSVMLQPLSFVYVIVVVPAATPVTTPLLVIVATDASLDAHGVLPAGVPDPVRVTVLPTHTVEVPVIVGNAFTVTVSVMLQPLSFVYVIVVVPAATPVTTPLLVIVATDASLDAHGVLPAGVPDPVRVTVLPTHTVEVPVIVGNAFTVTVSVMLQPLSFVYVIVVVPAATPVTTPLLVIVATDASLDAHGVLPAGVPDPVRVTVLPTHTVEVPVIVGNAFTVTVSVMLQPLSFVYVIVVVPAATPVTTPLLVIVATDASLDAHGVLPAGVPDPVRVTVLPTHTVEVPVIVGNAFTVTVSVMLQPLSFVYVIVVVPAATPVTTPLLVIVATDASLDAHGVLPAGVPDPVRVTVLPTHTVEVPVIVGNAFTVMLAVAVFGQVPAVV